MRSTIVGGLMLLASASALSAQQVSGLVLQDSTTFRIPGAQVTMVDARGNQVEEPVRSDSTGKFVIHTRSPGRYQIRANRIGFQPVTTGYFELGVRNVIEVQLNMSPTTIVLNPLVITANRILSSDELMSVEGFEYRRRRTVGSFYDTLDIRRSGFPPFTEALKQFVPGLYTETDQFGNELLRMRILGAACEPVLFRDGIRQSPMSIVLINNTKSQEWYGIEAYRRGTIPREFQEGGNECAVIALWTKWHARATSQKKGDSSR